MSYELGKVHADGANVIIRNSYVASDTSHVVMRTSNGGTIQVEDSTVRALNGEAHLVRGNDVTLLRNDLRNGSTVVQLDKRSHVEGNFIADPGVPAYDAGHHDAYQVQNSPEGPMLKDNTIIARWQKSNSAVFIQSHLNWSGVASPHVEGNFMSGGGYTFYLRGEDTDEGVPDAVIIDSVWNAGSWDYGPVSRKHTPNLTWENNYDTDGNLIEP